MCGSVLSRTTNSELGCAEFAAFIFVLWCCLLGCTHMRVCREECQAVHLASIYTGLVWLPLVLLHAWNSAQGLLLFGTGGGVPTCWRQCVISWLLLGNLCAERDAFRQRHIWVAHELQGIAYYTGVMLQRVNCQSHSACVVCK